MPTAKSNEIQNARRVEILPWVSINPTISGILARWQGLSIMLKTPHRKEANKAIQGAPSTACVNWVKSVSTACFPIPCQNG